MWGHGGGSRASGVMRPKFGDLFGRGLNVKDDSVDRTARRKFFFAVWCKIKLCTRYLLRNVSSSQVSL